MENLYLKENVSHNTEKRPFSLHHTDTMPNINPVLYKHWHNEIEFFYLKSGEVEFFIEDIKIQLSEGEAVLIPPNLLHWAENISESPCSFNAVVFHPDLFYNSGGHLYHRFIQPIIFNSKAYVIKLSKTVEWQSQVIDLLIDLLLFHNLPDVNLWELEFYGLLYRLWNKIYVNWLIKLDEMRNYNRLSNKLINSIDYIHANYKDNITVQQLASSCGLSIGAFCRYFKQLNGYTPMNYINRYRIMNCCELLIDSDLKITDIAFKCGFNNLSHFNREFLKYMNCTPSQYKK